MKIAITQARKNLPDLVRQVQSDESLSVQITVHGTVAAELRASSAGLPRGAAVRKLREVMANLPAAGGRHRQTSREIKKHL